MPSLNIFCPRAIIRTLLRLITTSLKHSRSGLLSLRALLFPLVSSKYTPSGHIGDGLDQHSISRNQASSTQKPTSSGTRVALFSDVIFASGIPNESIERVLENVDTRDDGTSMHRHSSPLGIPPDSDIYSEPGTQRPTSARISSLVEHTPGAHVSPGHHTRLYDGDGDMSASIPERDHIVASSATTLPSLRTNREISGEEMATAMGSTDTHEFAHEPTYKNRKAVLWPMSPSRSNRYERIRRVDTMKSGYITLPMQRSYHRENVPDGWKPCIHPEGTLLYYNETNHTMTETFLESQENLELIEFYLSTVLLPLLRRHEVHLSLQIQLVIELVEPSDRVKYAPICGYYLVDHENHCLFWPEAFNADWAVSAMNCKITDSHFGIYLESEYWKHREYFPGLHPLRLEDVSVLSHRLIGFVGDRIVSPGASTPWTLEKMQSILELTRMATKEFKLRSAGFLINANIEWYIARCLCTIEYFRFSNFHGEPQARIDHRMKLYAEVSKHPQLLNVMSFLFFHAPRAYIKDMYQVAVDGRSPDEALWQEFFVRLVEEWQSILLLGEVLLAVNVSFVAIPSVDISNQSNSISQIFSYVLSVASFGSIVSGLLLIRQSSIRRRDSSEEAINFYVSVENSFLGIEGLVITYSLPYALLIWGILSFATGFCAMCFKATNLSTKLPVGLAVSTTFFLVFCFVVNPRLRSEDSSDSESASHRWKTVLLEYLRLSIKKVAALHPNPVNASRNRSVSNAEGRISVA